MNKKIILPGGAGLVGQNLLVQLKEKGYTNITVIDKHHENIKILKQTFPDVEVIEADLAEKGDWEYVFNDADVVVMLQAQIGAKQEKPFIRNNVISTKNILNVIGECKNTPYLVHISSSVLESVADDFYTHSKKEQEEIVNKENMWKMDVKEEYVSLINKLATGSAEFTKAEQETLAVIAYKQPVKQSVIIKIRGNKAYEHIKNFIGTGLVQGKRVGHTKELTLSDTFFEYFHLVKKSDGSVEGIEMNEEEINEQEN